MQLSIFVDGVNLSHLALLEETEITRDSTDSVSTARVVFWSDWSNGARYGTARYGQAYYAFQPKEWSVLELKDQAGVKQFRGLITQINRVVDESSNDTRFECAAADMGILLDRITINDTFLNETDSDLIQAAFASQTAVTVDPGDITTIVADMGVFEAKDITLRELLERVCELTGGEWRVDYDDALHYYRTGLTAAPFAVSDSPNGTTSFEHRVDSLNRDSSNLANRITVLAGFDSNGAEITALAQELESQGRYGILSATVVDRSIEDQATANLMASAELSQRAFPVVSGTLTQWRDGLDVGQTLTITNRRYGLNGDYLIRTIRIKQVNKEAGGVDVAGGVYCVYEVEFGQRIPDLIANLRRQLAKPKQPTTPTVARPAPASIAATNFASTIEPVRIVNSLPFLPDPDYSENAVILLTLNRKLYRRTGNDWTAAVETIDLDGQITNTQISDNAISTPKLQANSVVAGKIATNAVTAGTIAADAVTAGTIAAGAIRASDAAFDVAAIQTADIANAAITNAKVNDLSASKLTAGTIDASVISVINLNATNITTGSMSASRIGAGTITASVSMTSPSLTITAGTTTVNIDATNIVKVTDSGFNRFAQISAGKLRVEHNTSNFLFVDISAGLGGGLVTVSNSVQSASIIPNGFFVDGSRIVGPRLSPISDPSGGATVDSQCRAVVVAILASMRFSTGHGLISG